MNRDGYMLVNMISALQFITSINANCLSINPLDYQMYVWNELYVFLHMNMNIDLLIYILEVASVMR